MYETKTPTAKKETQTVASIQAARSYCCGVALTVCQVVFEPLEYLVKASLPGQKKILLLCVFFVSGLFLFFTLISPMSEYPATFEVDKCLFCARF